MANAGTSLAAGLVPGARLVGRVHKQEWGSVSQVESRLTASRERGVRPGGVLGWPSRPVWHRGGNPVHNNDERDDSSCSCWKVDLPAESFGSGRQVAFLVGSIAAKPGLSGRRDELLQRI